LNDNIDDEGVPESAARGPVSQFLDGPVSEFYQSFVNNRSAMRRFNEAKARHAERRARDAANANDIFEPRSTCDNYYMVVGRKV